MTTQQVVEEEEAQSPFERSKAQVLAHVTRNPGLSLPSFVAGALMPLLEELEKSLILYVEARLEEELAEGFGPASPRRILGKAQDMLGRQAQLIDIICVKVGWRDVNGITPSMPPEIRALYEQALQGMGGWLTYRQRVVDALVEEYQAAPDDEDEDADEEEEDEEAEEGEEGRRASRPSGEVQDDPTGGTAA